MSYFPWLCKESTTAAWCWKITRKDNVTFGFTSHDKNISYGGVTYEAATGFTPTAVETSNNMAVDNLDIDGVLNSDYITADDVDRGLYDGASVDVFLVNYENTTDPIFVIRRGFIGKIENSDIGFTAEIRGLLDIFQRKSVATYQKTCRAKLGDDKCKKDISGMTDAALVTSVSSNDSFAVSIGTARATGHYDYGVATFIGGQNNGSSYEVKHYDSSTNVVTLFLPTTFPIEVGYTVELLVGCDGNFSTCRDKFSNYINFRGEPSVPGTDYVASYASRSSS